MATPTMSPGEALAQALPPELIPGLIARLEKGESISELLGLNDEELDLVYFLGHHLYGQGKLKEALKVFGTLATLAPLKAKFQHALATCLHKMGHLRDAIERYTFLVLIEPDNPEAMFRLAECLLAEREREAAVGFLQTIVQEADDRHAAWRLRAEALLKLQLSDPSPLPGASK